MSCTNKYMTNQSCPSTNNLFALLNRKSSLTLRRQNKMASVAGTMSSSLLHHHLTTISKPTLSLFLLAKPYPNPTLISCSRSRSSTRPPPSGVLLRGADAKTQTPRKKWKPLDNSKREGGGPPRISKAARRFYNENFREPPQRLGKVLAAAGVASRRSSEELIFAGKVTVNGAVCNTPQTRVDPVKDVIYVNGNRLPKKLPRKVYLALNKPKGYICSSGEDEKKSVISLFDDYFKIWGKRNPGLPQPRLFTVGRLDVATTGLIIVTNDGDFAQSLSHPSANLSKEYITAVEGDVTKRQLLAISDGTMVEGVYCTPDFVELLPSQPGSSRQRLRIVVHQGRKHEVRELVKNAGLEIHSLKRVRIGGYRLPPDLGIGKHLELKPADLKSMGWKG